jgi:hypothetical protein
MHPPSINGVLHSRRGHHCIILVIYPFGTVASVIYPPLINAICTNEFLIRRCRAYLTLQYPYFAIQL